ncbi:BLUF domain-containing protein [Bdellovibrionota bacterium FG-2]
MKIFHLLYISTSIAPAKSETIQSLLDVSSKNNKAKDISGLLIYRSGYFIQLLEGDETVVNTLVARIQRDARHRDLKIVLSFKDEKRLFPHWSMGLITDDQDADMLALLSKKLTSSKIENRDNMAPEAIEILKSFSKKYRKHR